MHFKSRKRQMLLKSLKKDSGRIKRSRNRNRDGNSNSSGGDIHDVIKFFSQELDSDRKLLPNTSRSINPSTQRLYQEFYDHFVSAEKSNYSTLSITSKPYAVSIKSLYDHINPSLRAIVDSQMKLTYECEVFITKPISIKISLKNDPVDINNINKYFSMIIQWLHVVVKYASGVGCSNPLTIHIMLSDIKKLLPSEACTETTCDIKNTSVNTGYSSSCRHIVIYRKEEWFKVFIHETIHNFNLDFSPYPYEKEDHIKAIFGITNKQLFVKLFEAYTESWARMIHAMLVAYDMTTNNADYILQAHRNIQLEQINSYFQTAKIMKYTGLDKTINKNMTNLGNYTEDTANLSYYFIVSMLYNDFQDYIVWCHSHNKNTLQFNNDRDSNQQEQFVFYIQQAKEKPDYYNRLKYYLQKYFKSPQDDYLYLYMRKSLLERKRRWFKT